jgi:hypothetical protein
VRIARTAGFVTATLLLAVAPRLEASEGGIESVGSQFRTVVIDNSKPRRDTDGQILDAHEGCLRFFNGKYYLYGTRFGHANGEGENPYGVYSSADLEEWTNEGIILTNTAKGTLWRPHVVYNEKTHKYVLWYHGGGGMGVATADRPEGPFHEVNADAPRTHQDNGDLGLFRDSNGTAYITYTYRDKFTFPPSEQLLSIREEPIPYYRIVVEELSLDYLSGAGRVTAPVAGNSEAPSLFRRGDLYYLMFDNTCGFCAAGTGARVYIARQPLGPFTYKGNINRAGPQSRNLPSPWTKVGTGRKDAIVKAQQSCVAVLPGPHGEQYLWMGDRWGSTPDGIKGHDLQYWAPLLFDPDGMIQQLENKSTWTLQVAVK